MTQWSYCSGGGGGPRSRSPSHGEDQRLRLERAAELDVDTLVSACPWSERPLSEAGDAQDIDVVDLHELFAQSLGITVGGSRGDVGDLRWPRSAPASPGPAAAGARRRPRRGRQRLRMRRQRLRMRGH